MLRFLVLAITLATVFGSPLTPHVGHKGGKIIGGGQAEDKYPYIVSLNYQGDGHACGASILNANWILTAAHCCMTGSPMEIYAGSWSLSSGGRRYQISKYLVHGNYNPNDHWANDICLLQLAESIQLSDKAKPVTLPPANLNIPSGDSLVIIGWGVDENGQGPDKLKILNDKALSNDECRQKTGVDIKEGQLCTYAGLGQAVCSGDSGGPLTRNGVQVGLTSWGYIPCGTTGMPDVFTRVSTYIDWISQSMGSEAKDLVFATAEDLA